MPTARPDSASITSGAGLWAGIDNPLPAWMAAAIGEWAQIPGTATDGSIGNYSGIAIRDDEDRVELCMALGGGHTSGQWLTDNRVQTLRLDVAAPGWLLRRGPSDATGWDSSTLTDAYFPSDGRPVPRHTYVDTHWVAALGAYMFGGTFAGISASLGTPGHEAFVPAGDGGDWAGEGAYPDRPTANFFVSAFGPDGVGYSNYNGTHYKWTSQTVPPAWSLFTTSGATSQFQRGGTAYDSARGILVQIGGGGWFVQSAGTRAQKIDWTTGVRTDLSFNASAAWTDFEANAGKFVGTALVYAADDDVYYLYNGNTGSPVLTGQGAKVYKIIPNGTDTWDMEIVPVTGITPADEGGNSGVYSKFRYIPRWKTLILAVANQSVYYLRVGEV